MLVVACSNVRFLNTLEGNEVKSAHSDFLRALESH
jgi:hypothetical protein